VEKEMLLPWYLFLLLLKPKLLNIRKVKNGYEWIGYIIHFGRDNDGYYVGYSKNLFDNK